MNHLSLTKQKENELINHKYDNGTCLKGSKSQSVYTIKFGNKSIHIPCVYIVCSITLFVK